MNFIEQTFDGVNLIIPDDPEFFFPVKTFNGFPDCCGSGKIGNRLTPDKLYGLSISVACWGHDWCFGNMRRTWGNFYRANLVFYKNATRINIAHSHSTSKMLARQSLITLYAAGVNTAIGAYNFFRGERE